MFDRIVKVNELILQQLGEIINQEVELPPNTLVTIIKVNTSKDLHYSEISLSVFPKEQADYIVHKMNLLAKRLQTALAEKIVLRNSPKLKFVLDQTESQAEEIEIMLDKIKEEIND